MSINFFEAGCQDSSAAQRFGIRDTPPAYITTTDPNLWIATVENPTQKNISFTAVDKCIENIRDNGEDESSCDCILTYDGNIVFIELKEKTKAWKNSGIEQLEKTIEIYNRDAGLAGYARRRAYVANRKHPNFQVIETDIKQRLYQTYKVRVMAEATIHIN